MMLGLLITASFLSLSGLVHASPALDKRASCACGYKDESGRIWVRFTDFKMLSLVF